MARESAQLLETRWSEDTDMETAIIRTMREGEALRVADLLVRANEETSLVTIAGGHEDQIAERSDEPPPWPGAR